MNLCNLWLMVEDLSRYHRPVSDLFPAREWDSYRLSDEQVSFYKEHGYLAGIRMLNEDQLEVLRRELAELVDPAGSFHHPLMVHGSYANETAQPRRAVVINAFRDDVMSASNTPLLEGVPPIPAGCKIEGQFFPLLFDPTATKT